MNFPVRDHTKEYTIISVLGIVAFAAIAGAFKDTSDIGMFASIGAAIVSALSMLYVFTVRIVHYFLHPTVVERLRFNTRDEISAVALALLAANSLARNGSGSDGDADAAIKDAVSVWNRTQVEVKEYRRIETERAIAAGN